ncbi:PQQ-binding-like beta-propeller repeat protein [Streptomyces sp. NBC_00076]|uniref:outer membrane protein assembly factor BamB family protein n=1 Tax=Streptomyces sp. NBC_00076 TaxID=2975642 RepID=UPI00324DF459
MSQPPVPPEPYGQPQQQSGPYGQPYPQQPGPYGQQIPQGAGYGAQNPYAQPYPQPPLQAPVQTGPGGPGGPGVKRRRLVVVLGSVVAALLVIGVGAVALLSGDQGSEQADGKTKGTPRSASPKPTGTKGTELFQVAAPKEGKDEYVQTPGAWVTSRYFASGEKNAVTGYDLATGRRAWTIPLSGGLCGASRDITGSGLVAVVFHATKDTHNSLCSRFAVIDVNKGATVWEKPIVDRSISLGLGLNVAISDSVATAGWPSGSAGFTTSSGAPLWVAPAQGCAQEEHLGGRKLLTLAYCQTSAGMRFRVGEHDPRTGKATWTYQVPKARGAWLVSSEPLVLGLVQSEDGLDAEQLVTVSDQGKVESTVELGDDYVAGCGETGACAATVVAGNTAYIGTDPHSYTTGNKITAFDLRTGKPRRSFDATDKSTWVPLRADGKALIALQMAEPRTPARVLRLDPGTGQATKLLEMPNELAVNSMLHSMISKDGEDPALYEGGQLFLHDAGGYQAAVNPMSLAFSNR